MIDVLKLKCEEKIGFKIINLGDCKFLSEAILHFNKESVNYNTLRRIWGLAPNVKTSYKTLNSLSRFVGYKSYIDFNINDKKLFRIHNNETIYECINSFELKKIELILKEVKNSSSELSRILIIITRELIYLKQYQYIDELFRLKILEYDKFSYSEILHIGNSIGLLIRNKSFSLGVLSTNSNFIRIIYLTFVDYSSIRRYYINWTNSVITKTKSNDIFLFCKSIIQLNRFLENKIVYDNFIQIDNIKSLHPILIGRLLSIKILSKNYNSINSVLDPIYKDYVMKKNIPFELSYELMITSISSKNFSLMHYIMEFITTTSKPFMYFHEHHLNIYFLMSMFYYKKIRNTNKKNDALNNFNFDKTRKSYKEFILLILCVFNFNNTKSQKLKIEYKNDYLNLSNKLNYPIFSEDYLINYFQ